MIIQPEIKIASGHNNVAGLIAIEALIPSGDVAFQPVRNYGTFDVGQVKTRLNGRPYFAGRQSSQFISQVMTVSQFKYLKDTYCAGGYSGLVTVRLRPNTPASYTNYNATLVLPKEADLQYRQGYFLDVIWTFIDLQVI